MFQYTYNIARNISRTLCTLIVLAAIILDRFFLATWEPLPAGRKLGPCKGLITNGVIQTDYLPKKKTQITAKKILHLHLKNAHKMYFETSSWHQVKCWAWVAITCVWLALCYDSYDWSLKCSDIYQLNFCHSTTFYSHSVHSDLWTAEGQSIFKDFLELESISRNTV